MNETELAHKRDKHQLGFWAYIMTDCMLFASVFATYMILKNATAGGPGAHELFDLGYALILTVLLLTSSYTAGLANLALHNGARKEFIGYLAATIVLGISFLVLELREFGLLIAEGHGPDTSAFLSGFFTLVGLHGAHIAVGLLWAGVLAWAVYRQGRHEDIKRKFGLFSIYWHFLDVVWIFIFTIVYALGVA